MNLFLQQVVGGVSSGAVYAALALAVVMTYRASKLVNFAQGELATLAAFLSWQMWSWGLPLVVAALVAVVLSGLLAAGVERALIRPLGIFRSHLPIIVLTLGLMIVVDAVMGWVWEYQPKEVPGLFGDRTLRLAGAAVSAQSLGTIAVIAVLAALLGLVMRLTPIGLALRASSENPQSARLSGIRVGGMLSLGWGIAGMIGAVAGILAAPVLYLQPNMFQTELLYAFAAAILGGINSPVGAVVGGVAMGVLENMVGTYVGWIGNDFKQAVALAAIVAVLLLRPHGLFGQKVTARV